MTDTTDANEQNSNADAGQNPTTKNESGSGEQNSKPTGIDALPPETQKELRDLRKENAANRKRVEDFENANKTELDKREDALKQAEERATAAETRLQDANARNAVNEAATRVNAVSVNAVYALVRSSIEFDDDGEPTNIADLIAAAKKDEPALFRAAGGTGDGGKSGTGNDREISAGLDRLAAGYEKNSKAHR